MKKSFIILFFTCLVSFSNTFSQNSNDVVAEIGNDIITAKEFKIRFELSPYIPLNKGIDPDSLKYDFLYSFIAEKLWALEAENNSFTKSNAYDFYLNPLRDLFVRDALFKQEIKDKVVLSANDITNGINKLQIKLNVQIISTKDSALVYNFYNELSLPTPIDS